MSSRKIMGEVRLMGTMRKTPILGRGALETALAVFSALALTTLSGCFNSGQVFGTGTGAGTTEVTLPDFTGCVDGQGVDSQSISVNFQFPAGAEEVDVYRNGTLVGTSIDASNTNVIDGGLSEGRNYTYVCKAIVSGKTYTGSKSLLLSPASTNPPTFSGVRSATASSGRSIRVIWPSPTGVIATSYYVYVALGTSSSDINWNASPAKILTAGVFQTDITSVSDELPYVVGVRACSAAGLCDDNTSVIAVTTPDGGAPTSPGLSTATLNTATHAIDLALAWSAANGGIKKRYVYKKATSVGASCGADLSTFTLDQTLSVSNVLNPPSTASITGIVDNTQYCVAVQDEDASGNKNASPLIIALNSGDQTPPVFSGLSTIAAGSPADTAIQINFTAIAPQTTDVNGATSYLIFIDSTGGNACASTGAPFKTLDATAYTSGQTVSYNLTGLSERTSYDVCLKASDQAGNRSVTSSHAAIITRDITAPVFAGITSLAYSTTLGRINVGWSPSTSGDVFTYQMKIWKNQVSMPASPTVINRSYTNTTGSYILNTEFAYTDLDTVYVVVNACDAASPTFNSVNNCTALTTPMSVTLPDVTAPQNFTGIKVSSQQTTPAQGQVGINWNAPSDGDWSDYKGFKIYSVDTSNGNALTFLKDCACANGYGCSDHLLSCTVTGLDARRTYTFHVRAYDAAGNITTYLDPASSKATKQTTDTTPPTFISALGINYSNGIALTWSAASDNQYASESGATLSYLIYRKQGSSFASFGGGTSVPSDGTLIMTQTATSYTDPVSNLVDGATFYYTICAKDASNNVYCDGNVKNKIVPDITPPSAFTGIQSAPNLTTPSEGHVGIVWNAPPDWTDYSGFKVYTVDTANGNALTEIADCACSGNNCPNHLTSCVVPTNGQPALDARRTYTFHVRAYDASGNLTTYLDPASSKAAKQTSDTTAPIFSSGLTASYSSGAVQLGWGSANDNQYASESGAAINYELYRKVGSTFASFSQGSAAPSDGTKLVTQSTRLYSDVPTGLDGQTLYYTVCAVDASNNRNCDGYIKNMSVSDVTPPVVSGLTNDKATTTKTWNLFWTLSDNISPNANLYVSVYRKVGATNAGSDLPTTSDTLVTQSFNLTSLFEDTTLISGTANAEVYVNYLVVAADQAGNTSVAKYTSAWVDNKAPTSAPALVGFNPASPSKTATTTSVSGTSSSDTASISLYKNDAACGAGNLLVSGTKTAFEGSGLSITVSSNTTTSVYAQASDAAANKGACTLLGSYTHDNIAPTLASLSVTNTAPTNTRTLSLTFGSTTDNPAQYCLLENSTALASCSWQNYPLPPTFTVASDGSKVISAYIRDLAGNTSSVVSASSINVDTVAPIWSNSVSVAAWSNSSTSVGPVTYSANATDGNSGLQKYEYAVGTGTSGASLNDKRDWTQVTSSPFTISSGLSLAEGTYYVNMRALDNAGNQKVNSSNAFVVDLTPPSTPNITNVSDGDQITITASGSYVFTGTCEASNTVTASGGSGVSVTASSCNSSGVLSVTASITGLNSVTPVSRQINVYTTDAAGNASSTLQRVVLAILGDTTPPVVSSLTNDKTTTGKSWNLSWSISDDISSSGNINVKIYRKVGTTNAGGDLPTTSDTLVTSGLGLTSLSGETNISGTSNAEKYVNYLVLAFDQVNNQSVAQYTSAWIDNKPPVSDPVLTSFTPTSPSNSSTTPAVVGTSSADTATVSLYKNDAACGVGNLLVSGTKAAFEGSGLSITVTANAATSVYAQASDSAANKANCVLLGSYTNDSVKPTLASLTISNMTTVSAQNYANTQTLNLTWGATNAGSKTASINQYCILVNSATVGSCSWTATPLPTSYNVGSDGAKVLYAWLKDAAGNVQQTATQSASVTVDTVLPSWTSPGITIPSLVNTSSSFGSIVYSANASDALSGVQKYQYAIGTGTSGSAASDQKAWTDAPGSPGSSFTASSLSLVDGSYYVNMRVLDNASNASTIKSSSAFTVDTTPPSTPNITSVIDNQQVTVTAGGTYTFTGNCDSTSATITTIPAVGATASNVTTVSATCSSGTMTIVTKITGLTLSAYASRQIQVYTTDGAGNVSSTHTRTVSAKGVCPVNYVGVAGNATYGTSDFCVAKFDMKVVDTAPTTSSQTNGALVNSGNGNMTYGSGSTCTSSNASGCYPASRPDGTPWVNIQQRQAVQQCDRLNNGASSDGTGAFQLLTNAQWQTMAADIAAQSSNWSGGSVGSGKLARGNTDNSLADSGTHSGNLTTGTTNLGLSSGLAFSGSNALAAASSDGTTIPYSTLTTPALEFAAGYRGTGNYTTDAMGSGYEQRRTQYLSSGDVIWDVAGNVWEWVRYTQTDGVIDTGFTTPSGATNSASNYNSRYIPTQSTSMGATNWYEIGNPALFSSSFTCYLLGVGSSCTGNGSLNPLWFQPSASFWNNTSGTYPSDFNLGRIYSVSGGASSTYAVLRGGYWFNSDYGGVFASSLNSGPTNTGYNIGFRCAFSP